MFNFEEFKNEVVKSIKEYLPSEYSDSEVNVRQVNKNNVTQSALTIMVPGSNVSPSIYLDNFFDDYVHGASLEEVEKRIAELYLKNVCSGPIDLSFINAFDQIKGLLRAKLVGADNNEDFHREGTIFIGFV